MEIYPDEIDCGLEEIIKAGRTVAYLSPIVSAPSDKLGAIALSEKIQTALANTYKAEQGLYPIYDLMVSTGWNLNDDIFLPEETWAARNTPKNHPFNFEHQEREIIGHITGNVAVDSDNNILPDDLKEFPSDFHIITSSLLYNNWRDEALQAITAQRIKDIQEGKYFVSMEAKLTNFDYGLKNENGEQHILARSQESAFLSRYLKAYGGKGQYDGYSIGRVLRNITFIGKGLVADPANPNSVIFNDVSKFQGVFSQANFLTKPKISVSVPVEVKMDEVQKLKEELAKAETAKASAVEDAGKSTAKVNELEKVVATKTAEVENVTKAKDELATAHEAVKAENADLKAKLEVAEANAKKAVDELANIKATQVKAARKALLVTAGKTEAEADVIVAEFADLAEDKFAKIVELAKATKKDIEQVLDTVEPVVATTVNPDPGAGNEEAEKAEIAEFVKASRTRGRKSKTNEE